MLTPEKLAEAKARKISCMQRMLTTYIDELAERSSEYDPWDEFIGNRKFNELCMLDLIQLLCIWNTGIVKDGGETIENVIAYKQTRYDFSDDMKSLLINTAKYLK